MTMKIHPHASCDICDTDRAYSIEQAERIRQLEIACTLHKKFDAERIAELEEALKQAVLYVNAHSTVSCNLRDRCNAILTPPPSSDEDDEGGDGPASQEMINPSGKKWGGMPPSSEVSCTPAGDCCSRARQAGKSMAFCACKCHTSSEAQR